MPKVSALGYIGIGVRDLAEWRTYATEVLGAQAIEGTSGDTDVLYLRTDDRQYRFIIGPGEDKLDFVGWEVPSPSAFEGLLRDLGAAGIAYKEDLALAAQRGVARLVTCADPAGNALEFYYGATVTEAPFVSPTGARFVTSDPSGKDLGFGHIVLTCPSIDEAKDFYLGTLGFTLSDTITVAPGIALTFTHVNPRHHSLALVQAPPGTAPALNHFMVEVENIDMVGLALDRVHQRGISLFASIGRHTNDRMLSFYMRSPSGFGVEYGCQGLLIDDAKWTAVNYTATKIWGHDPEDKA